MKVTAEDCLKLDAFENAQVAAGKTELDNEVRSVSVLDAASGKELKTEKAAGNLIWRSATMVTTEDIFRYRETVKTEETEYQKAFAKILNH